MARISFHNFKGSFSLNYRRIDNNTEWNNYNVVDSDENNFCNHDFDADDIMVGRHAQSYSNYTELPTTFFTKWKGGAVVNRFLAEHNSFALKPHVTTCCLICGSDNSSLVLDGFGEKTLMGFANYAERTCNSQPIETRPTNACSYQSWNSVTQSADTCDIDWTRVVSGENSEWSDRCCNDEVVYHPDNYMYRSDVKYSTHGMFMKTELYEKVEKCRF